MRGGSAFIDTNVLLYLLSADVTRADRAESVLAAGGVISVQVLNEFASVASRKLRMALSEIREILDAVRTACAVVPLSETTHDLGVELAERHGFAVYDAMIAAAALEAGCSILFTEDLQDGLRIGRRLRVRNPFAPTAR